MPNKKKKKVFAYIGQDIPDHVKYLEVDTSVTSIPYAAFQDCTQLKEVLFHDDVSEIRHAAFSGCAALTNIEIPRNVKIIWNNSFYGCTALLKVTLPKGLQTISYSAFAGCSTLQYIEIPSSVEAICAGAFEECISLKYIRIPSSVKNVERRTFLLCRNLTKVDLCEGLISIGYEAFRKCTFLEEINIPTTLQSIDDTAFGDSFDIKGYFQDALQAAIHARIHNHDFNLAREVFHNAASFDYVHKGCDVFSQALCNTSTINSTYYSSNHHLTTIGWLNELRLNGTDPDYSDVAVREKVDHISTLLELNRMSDKTRCATIKVLRYTPLDMKPLLKWELVCLPKVVAWFDRAINTYNATNEVPEVDKMKLIAIYQFVHSYM